MIYKNYRPESDRKKQLKQLALAKERKNDTLWTAVNMEDEDLDILSAKCV